MANGNGTWKWVAVALWGLTMTVGGFAGKAVVGNIDGNSDSIAANTDSIHEVKNRADSAYLSLHRRMDQLEVCAVKQSIQLGEIAKAVGAPVVVDTLKDTIP
jgi:hypothetical protein